jgi:hypothetical protein
MRRSLLLLIGLTSTLSADIIYSSIPGPLPASIPSQSYEATATSEFGAHVVFAGTERTLGSVTVVVNDWAYESEYEAVGTSSGYYVPMTLNLFNVAPGGGVGSLLASVTTNQLVPWRAEPSPLSCPAGANNEWLAADGCHNGENFTETFDFTGVTVPNELIFGLAYNTHLYGSSPTGAVGPYNSLNFAVASAVYVGSNPEPGVQYQNASNSGFIAASGWGSYNAAAEFVAIPEPQTWLMLAVGLALLIGPKKAARLFTGRFGEKNGNLAFDSRL